MSNTTNDFSNYNKFYIHADGLSPIEVKDLIGWEDFGLDGARNMDYHGTLTLVSKELKFVKDVKNYILSLDASDGVLLDLKLTRLRLKVVNEEVVWVQDDPVYADFETLSEKEDYITLNFYSSSLMTLIDAHETDEFELERIESIENEAINPLQENYVTLKGRSMTSYGESNYDENTIFNYDARPKTSFTIPTKIVSQGPSRHSTINKDPDFKNSNLNLVDENFNFDTTAGDLFYVNSVTEDVSVALRFTIDLKVNLIYDYFSQNMNYSPWKQNPMFVSGISIVVWQYNEESAIFEIHKIEEIKDHKALNVGTSELAQYNGEFITKQEFNIRLEYNQGITIVFGALLQGSVFDDLKIEINEEAYFEESTSRFLFYHDVINRLVYILTGKNDKFFSSFLGRKELGYSEDGEAGLVGFLSGLWTRSFSPLNKAYKSPRISLDSALTSISNAFNLGHGVEVINGVSKLVLEKFSYFYRDEIVGKFPQEINNYEITTDKQSLYSTLEFGYEKSGGVDQEMGLDEPNVKSQFISPLKKSKGKFIKTIKVRADEYKLEELRRKQSFKFPDESMSGDEDNWFLDLKRSTNSILDYEQLKWSDKLDSIPTGIHDPDSFRTFRFTPATILRRFANNFKSGMYLYGDKFINFISGSPNVKLFMKFSNEEKGYSEDENVLISDLKRPKFKSKKISFTHPWSPELEELILGKTEVSVNGVIKLIPNFHFKMEFRNTKGEVYRGYYLNHEFKDNPTFEFQLSNEEII
jgi:hypothetical protein